MAILAALFDELGAATTRIGGLLGLTIVDTDEQHAWVVDLSVPGARWSKAEAALKAPAALMISGDRDSWYALLSNASDLRMRIREGRLTFTGDLAKVATLWSLLQARTSPLGVRVNNRRT